MATSNTTPPCTRAIGVPNLTGQGIAQKCGATPATPHEVSHTFRTPPGVMHHACKRGGSERNPKITRDETSWVARALKPSAIPPTTPKLANGTETTYAPPRGVPSTQSHQPKSTPARSGSKPEIAASPPRSPAETSRCAPLAVGSPVGTPCAHLRGDRWDPRGMSRTGRYRGGALRARRGAPGDVRSLPGNPPRGSQIRKWVACSPPRDLRRSRT